MFLEHAVCTSFPWELIAFINILAGEWWELLTHALCHHLYSCLLMPHVTTFTAAYSCSLYSSNSCLFTPHDSSKIRLLMPYDSFHSFLLMPFIPSWYVTQTKGRVCTPGSSSITHTRRGRPDWGVIYIHIQWLSFYSSRFLDTIYIYIYIT